MDLGIYIAVERLNRLKNEEITSEIGLIKEVESASKLISEHKSNLSNSRILEESDELIKRINEVALQIEDAVEHHRLNIKSNSCCWSRSYTYNATIINIKRNIKQLSLDYHHYYYHYDPEKKEDKRWTSPNIMIDDAIGVDKSVIDEIFQSLITEKADSQNNIQEVVVSLCGIGGIGKTTIAHQVVANDNMRYYFYIVHWISVTSNYSIRNVLVQILREYTTKYDEYDKDDENTMAKMVTKYISNGGRCLFVLDDVWSTQVLDDLQRLLDTDRRRGHAILVTTRKRQVAEFGIPKPLIINVRGLTQNGAWELFVNVYCRHTRGDDELIKGELEDISRKMVERCGGHPLAIIKLAQVLANRKSLAEWNAVNGHLMSFLNDSALQVLSSSFDDLPDHLKLCFIYLGLWPEDSFIDVEKLYHFWIVEGLVINQLDVRVGGASFDVAERYLTELEKMGMVETEDEEAPTVTRLKFCRIHPMMRLLCISKGNEIDFIQSSDSSARRLSLCLQSPEDTSSIDHITKKEHLRNLHILDPHKRTPLSFNIEELKLLRLVDFDGVNFGWDENLSADDDQNMSYVTKKQSSDLVLQGLSKLVYLKYLSFRRCFLNQYLSFPVTNLEILDLRVDDMINEVTLPNVLWKMRKMKHLYLPRMFRTYNGDKLRLDGMIELETLDNFITNVCNVNDLQTMNKLHNLSVKIDGDLPGLQVINEHLKKNRHIIHLSIDIKNFDCFVDRRHSLIREILQYPGVRIFCIEGHINELPSRYNICPSLTKIVLISSELGKDPMQKLYKLPNLRVLILDDNAFEGTNMVSPASGFTQLRHLQLLNLKFLESWTIENNSMPKLSNIKIENCNKLKIPIGLEFLTALKELEIAKMPKHFLHSLRKMETTQGEEDTALVNYAKITFPISDEITRSKDDDKAKASSSG